MLYLATQEDLKDLVTVELLNNAISDLDNRLGDQYITVTEDVANLDVEESNYDYDFFVDAHDLFTGCYVALVDGRRILGSAIVWYDEDNYCYRVDIPYIADEYGTPACVSLRWYEDNFEVVKSGFPVPNSYEDGYILTYVDGEGYVLCDPGIQIPSNVNAEDGSVLTTKVTQTNSPESHFPIYVRSIEWALPAQPSSSTPSADGVGAAGSSDDYSRADHVHPTDTTRAAAASVPASASIDSTTGIITFKNSDGSALFTLQLPLYAGGVSNV